jgi:MoaA/NifB/PqqE/SkfB family radical SAM enzyme
MNPTPAPEQGVINWNMNTTCNYRCSYCTQRFMDDRGRWAQDVPRFLEAFARLPGTWEIKLSGGEPFRHPLFLDVVSGIAGLGYTVSVVTNFSAREPQLVGFLEAAGDQLGVVSASLHLEYVDSDEAVADFIERGRLVQSAMPAGRAMNVTCVATRANLPRLVELKARFEAAGLRFKIQPEKQDRDVIDYTAAEAEQLVQLGGHNATGRIAPNFEGRPCWAGARYFILDDKGRAYRCYPARRYKAEYLGDFLSDEFQLFDGPRACGYAYCNCTVPIERGMMPTEGAPDGRRPGASP